jgi:hypothetical protein
MQRLRGQLVNIVLAVVALGLVIAVVVTQGRVTTGEREARENNLLSAFREDEITKLRIEGPSPVVLERSKADDAGETTWRITSPVQEEAEAYAMDKLLGSLEFATFTRRIKPEEVDRAAFGLDAPKWTLHVEMGSMRFALRLGKESPSPQGSHYLEVVAEGAPGSGVGVVSRDLVTELEVDAGELRGRQMMPYLSKALAKIVLEGKGGTRRVARKGERWYFDGMESGRRVERESFDVMLLQFARTKAEHFIDLAAAKQALGAAGTEKVRITMIPTDAKSPHGIVEVGGKCPKTPNDVVAVRIQPDPLAACVPSSVMAGLTLPASDLVDESLFSLNRDEIESLTVTRGKEKLDLARKDTALVLRAPVQEPVELDVGNQHLEAIANANGTLVAEPDLEKLGLKPAAGKARVQSVAESESEVITEEVELGTVTPDGTLHVRRTADGAVLALDRDTARVLAPDATLLRKKRLLDFSPSELLSVEIEAPGLHQRVRREPSGVWTLELPKDFDADASLATTLGDVLGSLEAERWVASKDDGTFGFDKPAATVRIGLETRDAGTTSEKLVIGSATSGGYFAKLESTPGVFVLPRRTLETLQTLLLDRSLFVVAPDAAEQLTFERDGKKVVLERRGATFEPSEPNPALSPDRIARITEALASLRAEAALHVGPAKADEGFAKPELTVRVDPTAAGVKPWSFRIGSGDSWQGTSIFHARRDGTNATYVIAKSKVRALLDALE